MVAFVFGALVAGVFLNLLAIPGDSGPNRTTGRLNSAPRRSLHDPTGGPLASQSQQHSTLVLPRALDPSLPGAVSEGPTTSSKGTPVTSKVTGAIARAGRVDQRPEDFDWRAYLLRYSDLRTAGVRTREAAEEHYVSNGFRESRTYQRIPVLLRYTACGGAFDQVYSHLSALVLAEYLGADVVLPPAVTRGKNSSGPGWQAVGAGALLDVDAVARAYASRGIKVHAPPTLSGPPSCAHPESAFPAYEDSTVSQDQVVHLTGAYLGAMHIWRLWDRAADRVVSKHRELVEAGWPHSTAVVLDLPCPLFAVMTRTCAEAAQEAAAALSFNRTVISAAREVIAGLRTAGVSEYRGVHLRLEEQPQGAALALVTPAADVASAEGAGAGALPGVGAVAQVAKEESAVGEEPEGAASPPQPPGAAAEERSRRLKAYDEALTAAGFSAARDACYVATEGGLEWRGGDGGSQNEVLAVLQRHCKSVQRKEVYLSPAALSALSPEQRELLDFLVLSGATAFVGCGRSTLGAYLREYRVLLGRQRSADAVAAATGADDGGAFERLTRFAPDA